MALLWNVPTLISGLLFGLGLSLIFFVGMGNEVLQDIREDAVDNAFLNSVAFELFFKFGVPVLIFLSGMFLVGPVFGLIYTQFSQAPQILGLRPELIYIPLVLLFSVLLDLAVLISRISLPFPRVIMNTWMFITFGIILPLLWHYLEFALSTV